MSRGPGPHGFVARGYEGLGLRLLHRFDPELAHTISLHALRAGLVPLARQITSPRLRTSIAGLSLANPVGLAAGYDKNAIALAPLSRAGFGFLEVGAATPRAQPGNPKPRVFRLRQDRAVINRFGFNNDGMHAIADRLAQRPHDAVIGLNLGANKDSGDRANDFCAVLETCAPSLDFATVNVSSPNTEKLRDLQGKAALSALLTGVLATRDAMARPIPIFLKIAPDLDDAGLADVAEVALAHGLDAIIATNTTLDRTGLTSAHRAEAGGLSGAPLFEKSTRVLARLSALTDGQIPLIGVGGIATPEQAYDKIRAGASAVQLYSSLVYGGLSLAADVAHGLDALLARDGFANVADAVGTQRETWL
ncbi:quinone-dependent dihydroorotate dehydrogenase [Pseudooceanicola sediminis]|uniref:Dihydroorotate dehydrogenase (quinone) n=1 Tax=Pseudooceanicola sediminis TaxID=2211117 RepID=A0A399J0J7_9RHOB|nr:quinone-dependent dihydroorotate dehydrogenase [Puniceibacterium sp. HSS470]RII38770.1 quinone-dependent dihydroorotate dehydrogenase [Pseudooceanicola sediminis]